MYRRSNKLVAVLFLLFASSVHAADLAPYVNTFALGYGRSNYYYDNVCTDLGQKFHGMIMSSNCVALYKAERPTGELYIYTNIGNCTSGDPLCTFIGTQGDPELYFHNATSDNTIQDFGIQMDITPDSNTFTRNNGQRICSYYASGWCAEGGAGTRWETNFDTSANRAFLVGYFDNTAPGSVDGYFFDNMGIGCNANDGQISQGTTDRGLVAGSLVSRGINAEDNCNLLRQSIADNLDNVYLENYGNYWPTSCQYGSSNWFNRCTAACNGVSMGTTIAQAYCISKGVFQEYGYRFTNTKGDLQNNYGMYKKIWDAYGSPATRTYVTWWVGSVGATGIAANSDRVKMMALGNHLLFQFNRLFMRYDGTGVNNSPLENDWFSAMAAPIGTPSGDKTVRDAYTDQRKFSNGIVVVRYRTSSGQNYTDNAVYSLDNTYTTVNANGTYGDNVTSVTLRNAEAFIGILSGSPPSDTTPPQRSNGSPSATIAAGTTQVTMSLNTDEAATCKYGTVAETAYASIANTFSTTGSTLHQQTISGLTNGSSYTYYIRCTDGTNVNTSDYPISWSVAYPSVVPGSMSGGRGGWR